MAECMAPVTETAWVATKNRLIRKTGGSDQYNESPRSVLRGLSNYADAEYHESERYLIEISSVSNTSVALGGITPPAPVAP